MKYLKLKNKQKSISMIHPKLIVIIIILLISVTAFSQKYFTGAIKYKVDVELYQEDHPWNEYLSKKWGDTTIVVHSKNGCYKRNYINSEPNGFHYSIYNSKTNLNYTKWHGNDTTYYYNCNEVVFEFLGIRSATIENILGVDCKSVTVEFMNEFTGDKVQQTYFYNENLKINHQKLANFKDSFLDKIYAHSKSHIVKWTIEEEGLYKTTFTAVEVERRRVKQKTFKLPPNPILKYY